MLAAGVWAGGINAVVGSGTLVTFPVLLAVGYPPVTANVSNSLGLVAGGISSVFGYRRELAGQWDRALRLSIASLIGGIAGAVLLLVLPPDAFATIVPVFIAASLVLVVLQPRIQRWLVGRGRGGTGREGFGTRVAVGVAGIYGGYFGAAQGIMLVGILGLTLPDHLQRLNALKNVLAGLVNFVAGLVFVLIADVAWEAVGLVAVGSLAGGALGSRYGRRLPAPALRGVIVIVGTVAIVQLLTR